MASGPVPSSYNLGRQSIKPVSNITAIPVDDQTAGHTQSSLSKTGNLYCLATMSGSMTLTQTATALDLAGKARPKGVESLAHKATYHLDDKPTITLFASKLPYKMVDHIYKVVRLGTFGQWAEAVQHYHCYD